MAEFKENVPVVQADPVVSVDIRRDAPMPVGKHRFSLVVVDDTGNESAPAVVEVLVRDTEKPTAILDIVNAAGAPVDATVPFAKPFILSGARSTDPPPGRIKEYRFTLLTRV